LLGGQRIRHHLLFYFTFIWLISFNFLLRQIYCSLYIELIYYYFTMLNLDVFFDYLLSCNWCVLILLNLVIYYINLWGVYDLIRCLLKILSYKNRWFFYYFKKKNIQTHKLNMRQPNPIQLPALFLAYSYINMGLYWEWGREGEEKTTQFNVHRISPIIRTQWLWKKKRRNDACVFQL
jgi:hypothetical protein